MGRHLQSLLRPPALTALGGGAEALVLRTKAVLDSQGLQSHPDLATTSTTSCCAWVSMSESKAERRLRRALREQFLDGECQVLEAPGLNWPLDLAVLFAHGQPEGIDLTLEVPGAWSGQLFELVQAFLENVRTKTCRLWTVVLVSETPEKWARLTGVTGHVKSAPGAVAADACAVFESLAALSAPFTLNCIDGMDVAEVLGTPENPSVVIPAMWFPSQEIVAPVLPEHASLLRSAKGVIGHPRRQIARLDDHRRISRALRACCSDPEANLLLHGAVDFMAWPDLTPGAVPLSLITTAGG